MPRLTIVPVKFGGSVLTDKANDGGMRRDRLRTVARLIAGARDTGAPDMVIVLGGGSIAHRAAVRNGLATGETVAHRIHAMSKSMFALKCVLAEELERRGVAALPFHETSNLLIDRDGYGLAAAPIARAIASRYLPIVSGGPVFRADGKLTAFSSDRYGHALLASGLFDMPRYIFVGKTPGVLGGDGRPLAVVSAGNLDDVADLGLEEGVVDISGGMTEKVRIALDLAQRGVETRICGLRGLTPSRFAALVAGTRSEGTRVPRAPSPSP